MHDMIDLSRVMIHNSPDVREWPATTAITRLDLRPSGVHVEFTKQRGADRWPDFPFGRPEDHGSLQFTLWIVLSIGGDWHAAGCIEFWFGLDENGGPVNEYANNWYYDPHRWAPMTGHQPQPGDQVGFFITSGDARHGDDGVGLHERSNVVKVIFPDAAGGSFMFDHADPSPAPVDPPAPNPQPAPAPTPAPTPAPVHPDYAHEDHLRLMERLEEIVLLFNDMVIALEAIALRLGNVADQGVRVRL
jgi:hypothetical protein